MSLGSSCQGPCLFKNLWELGCLRPGLLSMAKGQWLHPPSHQPLLFYPLSSNRSVIPPSQLVVRLCLPTLGQISLERDAPCQQMLFLFREVSDPLPSHAELFASMISCRIEFRRLINCMLPKIVFPRVCFKFAGFKFHQAPS